MRDRSREIDMLEDTLQILKQGYYEKNGKRVMLKLSRKEMEEIQVYLPDEVKRNANREDFNPPFVLGGRCGHGCENMDSFALARKRMESTHLFSKDCQRVLVLNLANPVNPGGGVRNGARAQEEDLCRKSSLLLSLESGSAQKYYRYNRSLNTCMGSDALMITPLVEIIKDENGELLDETVVVSVLTCAAPMVSRGREGMSEAEYEEMVYHRIMGMLKCTAYLGYRILILGAWGCGAFGNDARVISDLFYKALKEINYNNHREKDLFRRIDFAVLDRTENQYNFKEFYRNFSFDNFFRDENRQAIEEAMERIREKEVNLDQIRGCMVGGAVGDALGYAVEFWDENQIFGTYGEKGITAYRLDDRTGRALISDDTQMALFTANGLLYGDTRGCMRGIQSRPSSYVAMAYQDWLRTQEISYEESRKVPRGSVPGCISWLADVPELYSLRAPGMTCLSALRKQRSGHADDFSEEPLNNSKGCGGIMRIAPFALNYHSVKMEDLDMEGAQIAAITHGHSLGYMPAAVLTHIINRIVFAENKRPLKEIVAEAQKTAAEIFRGDRHLKELMDIIDLAINLAENGEEDLANIHRIGEGWVAEETLGIALYCALRHEDDFSAGVIAAVNHKGDSDSTGAVTGNILGALLGFDAIEDKWKTRLELMDVIVEMADDVCHGCQMSEYSQYEDPHWTRKYIYAQWRDEKPEPAGMTRLTAVRGDITKDHGVQAIVNAANTSLLGGGGVDGAIHRAAGPELLAECRLLNGCRTGQAKITRAYRLPCEYVIHTPGPRWKGGRSKEHELLASCYRSCLELAVKNGIRSIAFPSVSTGIYGFPLDQASEIAVRTAKQFVTEHPGKLDLIQWVLFDDQSLQSYKDRIEHERLSDVIQSPKLYAINRMLRDGEA